MKNSMRIIIHGGFTGESSTDKKTYLSKRKSLEKIVRKGYDFLKNHTALETVVETVSMLEDDPLFNAGTGSRIQSDGVIRMSASVMHGLASRFGGVMNIEKVKNPVQVALRLLDEEDRVLSGREATRWARKNGFPVFNPETTLRRKEFLKSKNKTGTVGCVALDGFGNLAAATSTGGKGMEIPGRVSDSATVAGNYAGKYCAVSCTGVGEDIVGAALASKIVTRVTDGMTISLAFKKSFAELKETDGFAGAIGIDQEGNFGILDSHPSMVFAAFNGKQLEMFK